MIGLDIEATIAAVSTPPGSPEAPAMRSVVRISGPDCLGIASSVFLADSGADLSQSSGFRAVAGTVSCDEGLRFPAVAWCFRGPRSYTGQDVVELHLPGSAPLAGRVVERLLAAGGRAAGPGEFTLRAVLSGRIDLTGAEAVAELIAARSDGQLRAAMQLADGALARRVASINDALLDVLAEVEAGLDFADEPIRFITADRVDETIRSVQTSVRELRRQSGAFEALEHRPAVALVGRPNAGKSTLLNRLSGLERALCSPLAGTTRDVLAAPLTLPGGEALLLDGAGLGPVPTCRDPEADALNQAAEAAMLRAARSAELLLFVLDATGEPAGQLALLRRPELAGRPVVIVRNKIDLLGQSERPGPPDAIDASGATGQGIAAVQAAVNARLFSDEGGPADRPGEALMLNARHRAALSEAEAALTLAGELLAGADGALDACADLLAGHLHEAIGRLGQISGQVVTEDLLSRIFSRFCIGK